MNHSVYPYHADYIAQEIFDVSLEKLFASLDDFNKSLYLDPDRRFYVGILSLHKSDEGKFFTLETVEIDNMNKEMLLSFYTRVKESLDVSLPFLFKPANHGQEMILATMNAAELPAVYNHELFRNARFICLNPGEVTGRLRLFHTLEEFRHEKQTVEWYDIIAMPRVPDDIHRVSGIINGDFTTPLSHTNVLASGWQIPNAVQIGVSERIEKENLNGHWVCYAVSPNATEIDLRKIDKPVEVPKPSWSVHRIKLEEPETEDTLIAPLEKLRMSDRFRYGTKAANLGELHYILKNGSERLLGFYRISRPPRENLLAYLADFLKTPLSADLNQVSEEFLRSFIKIPKGIAIPFAIQQEFLQSSPALQQTLGKLKMALELKARQVDALCVRVQQLIIHTRLPDRLRYQIDDLIARYLGGVKSFVVRSSSNAEDLQNFSAAGIYESINHVTTADHIFESIKKVWASLLAPRSVRFRDEVGISLDDSYMGVIIQEEIQSDMGGVMVTTNPIRREDHFRDVYFNVSCRSVNNVVQGAELPYQYLFNTVEGGGRTISLGCAKEDLSPKKKALLQKLAVAGRLLQSHFSPDYTFSLPLDVEWVERKNQLFILQLRPYR
ncbi:MAG: phosphoenolpyruvate synthase, partial [Deltaproteobacteria bacterium]|nr:phosphoenolpyruvate synthase [Deltaproteobacteria bacterium]